MFTWFCWSGWFLLPSMKQLVVQSNVFTTGNQKIIWTFYRDLVVIMGRGFKISKVHGLMSGWGKTCCKYFRGGYQRQGSVNWNCTESQFPLGCATSPLLVTPLNQILSGCSTYPHSWWEQGEWSKARLKTQYLSCGLFANSEHGPISWWCC